MRSHSSERPERRGIFWAAAAVLVAVSLYTSEAGIWASVPYAVAAAICIVQFFWPTASVWFLIAGLFMTASAYYLAMLAGDIWRLNAGSHAVAMLDFDDSVVFVIFVLVLIVVTAGVFRAAPVHVKRWLKSKVQPNNSLERTRER
jgi:hypothetical protein